MHPTHLTNRPYLIGPALIVLTLLAAGCGVLGRAPEFGLSTPTATPYVQCSPEPCSTNSCSGSPGRCAGGCGIACTEIAPNPLATPATRIARASATPTATPTAALEAGQTTPGSAGGAPCTIVVRTPPPDAPTASANGTALPRRVDPHVEICASATRLRIGDTLTVLAQPVDIGLPYYSFSGSDNGSADLRQMFVVTYDNRLTGAFAASQVLEFVSAQAGMSQLVVTLRARAVGTTELVVGATGEVHYGYPGPATWSGGGSQPITVTVTN